MILLRRPRQPEFPAPDPQAEQITAELEQARARLRVLETRAGIARRAHPPWRPHAH